MDFCNSVQEGPRDFLNTPKCSQWPHLYTTCEATYALKCLFSEKIAKNCFLATRTGKNRFFAIFSKSKLFKAYVASQVVNKYDHCGYFKLKIKSLRPSGSKIHHPMG